MINQKDDDSGLFFQFLTNNLHQLNATNRIKGFFLEDILSINFLNTLINGYPFLPFSGASLRPFCLNHILNDILINNRQQIIEFGSGISTIVIGRLIKKNNLNVKLLSFEHDLEWTKQLDKLLTNENLNDVVKVYHAPLKESNIALDNNLWYDTEVLDAFTKNRNFDMVIVDGPPAWMKNKNRSRYPALPYMCSKLNENYSFYLDDAMREGESAIVMAWEDEFSLKFNYSGNSLAYHYHGHSFFTEPYVYY